MRELKKRLAMYQEFHDLTKPIGLERVKQFEAQMHVKLPLDFKQFLTTVANGGEILVPGTVIYGIYDPDCDHNQAVLELLTYWNRLEIKSHFGMPKDFFIIGTTSYGNLIGIDGKSGKVAEWDHETKGVIGTWNRFTDLVNEDIDNYEKYQAEEGEGD